MTWNSVENLAVQPVKCPDGPNHDLNHEMKPVRLPYKHPYSSSGILAFVQQLLTRHRATGVWPHSNLSSGGDFDFEIIGVVETVPTFVPAIAFECQAHGIVLEVANQIDWTVTFREAVIDERSVVMFVEQPGSAAFTRY